MAGGGAVGAVNVAVGVVDVVAVGVVRVEGFLFVVPWGGKPRG